MCPRAWYLHRVEVWPSDSLGCNLHLNRVLQVNKGGEADSGHFPREGKIMVSLLSIGYEASECEFHSFT